MSPQELNKQTASKLTEQICQLHRILNRTARARGIKIRSEAAAVGITPRQQLALQELVVENGLSLKKLSERMGLSHSTVSGIVDRLEAKKMVCRRPDENDRRINRIYLSERVKGFIKRARPQMYMSLADSISASSAGERARIIDGLDCLLVILQEEDEKQ